MKKLVKNPEERYPKLLHLTLKECNTLKSNGIYVPFGNYDLNKVRFEDITKDWSLAKKALLAKKLLSSIGLEFYKQENGEIIITCNYNIENYTVDEIDKAINSMTQNSISKVRKTEDVESVVGSPVELEV